MGEPAKDEIVIQPVTNEKLSRWWIICHLWGGLCLKIYLDMSGILKFLPGDPSGSDVESDAKNAGMARLIAFGAVAIGYLLSKSLVRTIESGAMASKGKFALKMSLPILYFVGAVLLAMATAPFISSTTSISKISTLTALSFDIKPAAAPLISSTAATSKKSIPVTSLFDTKYSEEATP